jgi:hypothetical protein
MPYGHMSNAPLEAQLAEAQRLMQESANNQRRAELEETRAAHAATSAKLDELTNTN